MMPQNQGQEPTVLQVFIFKDGRFFGTECFSQSQIVVGRSPDVDLQLDDDVTSRSHATIETEADHRMVLEDLGSSNGTYVNGEQIKRCIITARDEVSIGPFLLKFKLLSRKQPNARKDTTRIVRPQQDVQPVSVSARLGSAEPVDELDDLAAGLEDAEPAEEHNMTQVVDAGNLRAVREFLDGSTQPADDDHQAEIAAALTDELQGQDGFDSPPTDRLDDIGRVHSPGKEKKPKPKKKSKRPSKAKQKGEVNYQDQSVRWIAPETGATDEPLQLVGESEPMHKRPEQMAEPGPAVDAPEPPTRVAPVSFETAGLPGWLSDAKSSSPRQERPDLPLQAAEPLDPVAARSDVEAEDESEYEEENDQRDFVEPFSLLNNLIRENFAQPQVQTKPGTVMEVIGYTSEKEVVCYDQIARGKKYRQGPQNFVLVHSQSDSGRLFFTDEFSGGVITGGQTVPIDELKTDANHYRRRRGKQIYSYKLIKGDYANVVHEGGGSFIRFVNPPHVPKPAFNFKLDPLDLKIFGSSFLGAVLLIVVMSLFSTGPEASAQEQHDMFAKVDLKDLEMDKPEEEIEVPMDELPPPEPEKEKVEETKEEPKKKEKPKKKPKQKRSHRKRRSKATGDGREKGDGGGGGGAGMMAALGNLNQKKSSSNIVAAVSNLDAVRVPGGRSRYKVSGLVTKLPTSSVVTSRGRGVGVKAGIDLLRGGKGRGGRAGIGPGALGGGRTGKRGVGGVVFKAPKRKMRVRGTLSREAIAKVVRKHLKEIQYCYERNLMLNPKLSGKLVMEWTISTSGSVSVVKTKTNTMATPAVAMCVASNIKRWIFPKPKGGIVVVSYPFIFNSIGF
jgi:pSer/pThr/pTyr-binding forkhead associated (FHA) protein